MLLEVAETTRINLVNVTYKQFCKRYHLDPETEQARKQWEAYLENRDILRKIASR